MAEGAEEAGQRLEPHVAKEAEEEIVEAQGWIINDHGIIELVAYSTDLNGSSSPPQDRKICPATEPIKQ